MTTRPGAAGANFACEGKEYDVIRNCIASKSRRRGREGQALTPDVGPAEQERNRGDSAFDKTSRYLAGTNRP